MGEARQGYWAFHGREAGRQTFQGRTSRKITTGRRGFGPAHLETTRMHMLSNLKQHGRNIITWIRLFIYEWRFSKPCPIQDRPKAINVEECFDEFVNEFGGCKVSDLIANKGSMPLNADYFFEEDNIVAELKTFDGIFSGPDSITQLTNAYLDSDCTGRQLMGFMWRGEVIPPTAKMLIKKRMRRSIEQRIVKARKQLRETKRLLGNKKTRTLLLIAMNQTPVFGHWFMISTAQKIIADNYSDEDSDGIVYFYPNVPTQPNPSGMEFSGWCPSYRDATTNADLCDFVNLLGNRWLKFYGRKIGETNPIMEFRSVQDMKSILNHVRQRK